MSPLFFCFVQMAECQLDKKPIRRKWAVFQCESCPMVMKTCLECAVRCETYVCEPCKPSWKRAKVVHAELEKHGYCFMPAEAQEYGHDKPDILVRTLTLELCMEAVHKQGEEYSALISHRFSVDLHGDVDDVAAKFRAWVARNGFNENHLRDRLLKGTEFQWYVMNLYLKDDEERVLDCLQRKGVAVSAFNFSKEDKGFSVATLIAGQAPSVPVPERVNKAAVEHISVYLLPQFDRKPVFLYWR
jgi:hypothetical protein